METNQVVMTSRQAGRRPSLSVSDIMSSAGQVSAVNFMTGVPEEGTRLTVESVWNPAVAVGKSKTESFMRNTIDKRSLYAVRRENIASREMDFVSARPGERYGPPVTNIEHLVEKNYIIDSRLKNATPEKFPKVIMRRFHRVSDHDDGISYGMPRPPSRTVFQRVIDGIKREPSIVNIQKFPSLHEPVLCGSRDEFCEILGPSACRQCIENTIRAIGEQLQDMLFPMIDITTPKLIAPKLAHLLKTGHRYQVRKRRLQELGIEDAWTPTRNDKPVTKSACVKCRKPMKTAKIVVTSPSVCKMTSSRLYSNKPERF
ncbi:uncharacterized protein LOC127859596 [Dreissena polymorpha]|nr:uncharacterized protein LOC127859596 [Dreissena polymorpha]